MYAGDVVIFSACRAGLQHLLCINFQYGAGCDKRFSAEQSNAMIIRCKDDKRSIFQGFYLSRSVPKVNSKVKYLSHRR